MPRPRRRRRIRGKPRADLFKPAGIPARELETVTLRRDEFEAIRLKDHQGLSQEETADQMGVSQPTLHRLLKDARKKIAEAITEGKAIGISSRQ